MRPLTISTIAASTAPRSKATSRSKSVPIGTRVMSRSRFRPQSFKRQTRTKVRSVADAADADAFSLDLLGAGNILRDHEFVRNHFVERRDHFDIGAGENRAES